MCTIHLEVYLAFARKPPLQMLSHRPQPLSSRAELEADPTAAAKALLQACISGEVHAVEGICNGVRDSTGSRTLLCAFERTQDPRGMHALANAVRYGYSSIVASLIAVGFDPNARCSHRVYSTALHVMGFTGDTEIGRLLIQAGARLDSANDAGQTPEELAGCAKRADAAQFLRESRELMASNVASVEHSAMGQPLFSSCADVETVPTRSLLGAPASSTTPLREVDCFQSLRFPRDRVVWIAEDDIIHDVSMPLASGARRPALYAGLVEVELNSLVTPLEPLPCEYPEAIVSYQVCAAHPNLAVVYGAAQLSDGSVWLVTEWCPTSLWDELPTAPLSLRLQWVTQITQAVCILHECGLFHGSLHPEGILLDKTHNVKLAGYGPAFALTNRRKALDDVEMPPNAHVDITTLCTPTDALMPAVDCFSLARVAKTIFTRQVKGGDSSPVISDWLAQAELEFCNPDVSLRPAAKGFLRRIGELQALLREDRASVA